MRKNILSKVICIVAAFFLALALAGLCLPGSAVAASKIKSVTFESNDLDFTLGQSKATVAFKLNVKAAKAVVSIRNSDGKVVYSVTKKSVKKNKRVTVQWNGKDSGGSYVKPGKYYARVKVGKVYKNSAKMEVFEKEQEQGTETKDFAGGKGTEADPYQIATYQQLRAIERYNGKYFIQTADIDAGVRRAVSAGGENDLDLIPGIQEPPGNEAVHRRPVRQRADIGRDKYVDEGNIVPPLRALLLEPAFDRGGVCVIGEAVHSVGRKAHHKRCEKKHRRDGAKPPPVP